MAKGGLRGAEIQIDVVEVVRGLSQNRGVVALESTIITHGLPYPDNLRVARACEAAVRSAGAVPATIAVLDGLVHVGLGDAELTRIANAGRNVRKLSRRDLAACCADGATGGTTVSCTMLIAAAAGIRVFATGGIGGVHRGGEDSMDVSADLVEMGRTRLTVVCAGPKTLLDIPRTLEVLETQGVSVVSLGTSCVPGFYVPDSGIKAPIVASDARHVADMAAAAERLKLASGLLLCVPLPASHVEAGRRVAQHIDSALEAADAAGISGAAVTPWVLSRVAEVTKGDSVRVNEALVVHNASVAGEVAVCLMESLNPVISIPTPDNAAITVVGAMLWDVYAEESAAQSVGNDNVGAVWQGAGGVGRNITEALARLGLNVSFVSVVGDDTVGQKMVSALDHVGVDTRCVLQVSGSVTSSYVSIMKAGDLSMGITDASLLESHCHYLTSTCKDLMSRSPRLLVIDGNIPVAAATQIVHFAEEVGVKVWLVLVSPAKSVSLARAGILERVAFVSMNYEECAVVLGNARPAVRLPELGCANDVLLAAESVMEVLPRSKGLEGVLVTGGKFGAAVAKCNGASVEGLLVAALSVAEDSIVSTTGAGDCLTAGTIAAFLGEASLEESVAVGVRCAASSLHVREAVSSDIASWALLRANKRSSL